MAGNTIGLECKVYQNTGTFSSPTAVEVPSIMDVTLPLERNVAILKSRASVFELALAGLTKFNPTLKFLRKNDDTQQMAFLAACIANPITMVGLIFADGVFATAGTFYWKGEFIITKWEAGEPLEDGATIDAQCMPYARSNNYPAYVTVGS